MNGESGSLSDHQPIASPKKHFISCLFSTNLHYLPALPDYLLTRAMLTLNQLFASRIYATQLAYDQLTYKKYIWNAHQLGPPGTHTAIYIDYVTRTSSGLRGLDTWYCKLAMDQYHCSHFFVPERGAIQILGWIINHNIIYHTKNLYQTIKKWANQF